MQDFEQQVGLVLKKDSHIEEYEVQQLPECVKYINKAGCLVVDEEQLDNGRVTKIISYLPMSPYENRHWTESEMLEECIKHIYYTSNVDGGYIGDEETYRFLVEKKKLILIQKVKPSNCTCSIGYSPAENKWYGWSHRAIHGFTVGDKVEEGDITAISGLTDEYRIQHPEEDMSLPVGYIAKDLNGAKRMAIAFAEAVS